MTENIRDDAARTLAGQAGYLIGQAARAPSLHNTQPWRFEVSQDALELYADTKRQLRVDPDGREMLISCGAALYGLRLAIRSLGRMPEVELLPDTAAAAGRRPLAQVRLGPAALVTAPERQMLKAVPHRHTHRGSFDSGPLPAGLLPRLQDDARAEGATLIVIDSERARGELAAIVAASGRRQDRDPESRAETCVGLAMPAAWPGTACPRTPFLACPDVKPVSCHSATSTLAGASGC